MSVASTIATSYHKATLSAQANTREAPRRAFGPNAIGSALTVAQALIESSPFEGYRKVIDLSADSVNSWDGICSRSRSATGRMRIARSTQSGWAPTSTSCTHSRRNRRPGSRRRKGKST
jgi:hypothetical protein